MYEYFSKSISIILYLHKHSGLTPLNGHVQYDSTTYQSASTYSCNNMHRLTGESTLKCGSNGLWEGVVPFCDLTSCGTPIISSNVRVVGGGSCKSMHVITRIC
jgi:hypothetical protein